MSDKATIIRRLESAYVHALDELEKAEFARDEWAAAHLAGHVAGLKQALNLCKEPTQ